MFDLLFFVVVGLSTAFAVLRGGLRELSTLAALAVAGGITLLLIDPILAATGQTGSFFGTALIAVLLVGVFFIAAHIGLHLALNRVPLKGRAALANRVGGGVFGFLRGLALIGLGYLGYSYYLDEANQPDSVKAAMTRPVAAAVAGWFEGFAPEDADLDAPVAPEAESGAVDAAVSGYDRSDRNSLNEIVTTVTTTDPAITGTAPGAENASEEPQSADLDAIADILTTQEDEN
ncbi:MAG: CvpA family protein [Parvularculaceae bacterium]